MKRSAEESLRAANAFFLGADDRTKPGVLVMLMGRGELSRWVVNEVRPEPGPSRPVQLEDGKEFDTQEEALDFAWEFLDELRGTT